MKKKSKTMSMLSNCAVLVPVPPYSIRTILQSIK